MSHIEVVLAPGDAMMSCLRQLATSFGALVLLAVPLAAQTDEQVLASYRLTDQRLAAFIQASRNLVAAANADPSLLREDEEDDEEGPQSIAEIAAYYDSRPAVKRAITSTGMSSKDYVTFMFAMFQAGMAAFIVKQSQGRFNDVPPGIPHENVRFYQAHEAELDRIGRELRALSGESADADEE